MQFKRYIKELSLFRGAGQAIYVVLDNYKIHDSQRTKKSLLQLGDRVKLLFLPKYCPECNWMEHVWLQLHANVTRNQRCRSLDELMDGEGTSLYAGIKPISGFETLTCCNDVLMSSMLD